MFHVRPSDTFTINAVHFDSKPVYIQAEHRETRVATTLNGRPSITLIPQESPGVAELYGVPNRCK